MHSVQILIFFFEETARFFLFWARQRRFFELRLGKRLADYNSLKRFFFFVYFNDQLLFFVWEMWKICKGSKICYLTCDSRYEIIKLWKIDHSLLLFSPLFKWMHKNIFCGLFIRTFLEPLNKVLRIFFDSLLLILLEQHSDGIKK